MEDGRGKQPGTRQVLDATRERQREASKVKMALFLDALERVWPNVAEACKLAEIGRSAVYAERQRDEAFRQRWDEIIERNMDEIENTILAAGKAKGGAGYLFPMLKAYRKERYGDRIEHSGNIGNVTLAVDGGLGSPPIASKARTETPAEPEPTQDKGQG